jgi:multiple sugar transport system substrate-binding protein
LQQFVIGKPIWDAYLKGEMTDEKAVMKKIAEAVKAEMSKG